MDIKIGVLNINGYFENSKDLKNELFSTSDCELLCLTETKLLGDNNINVREYGYVFVGHNRREVHRLAPTGSGGVGLLVKEDLLEDFNVEILDKSYDGILAISIKHKITDYTVNIFIVYLPPERSVHGRDGAAFFNQLIYLTYLHCEYDKFLILGDFNARIGLKPDVDPELDSVPTRKPNVDSVSNQHGDELLDFLLETKMCILNGRTNSEFDNDFTFCHTRGKSVVDYIIVPHDQVSEYSDLTITPCNDIIQKYDLVSLCHSANSPPDHSLLTVKTCFSFKNMIANDQYEHNEYASCNMDTNLRSRYRIKSIPPEFLNSPFTLNALNRIIEQIECNRETQAELDEINESFATILYDEMNEYFPIVNNVRLQKRNKPNKPWWCEELSVLWHQMHDKETLYRNFKGPNRIKRNLQQEFKLVLNKLDKLIKQRKRQYERGQLIYIETLNLTNPNEFWDQINKLGPTNRKRFEWNECVDENGFLTKDINEILRIWESEYYKLYNLNDDSFDDDFMHECTQEKLLRENVIKDPLYTCNYDLNHNLELGELEKILTKMKASSAPGFDRIPPIVLKHANLRDLLLKLFQLCFDTGKIPSSWYQSLIYPVPKGNTSEGKVPLSFRGIHLLNCAYKIFTSIINGRLTKYMEDGRYSDVQNGFRSNRSCTEHVYMLDSAIRNASNNGNILYTCFIDLKKAFDFVNRDLLMLKLLRNGVDGKMYNIIEAMYSNPKYCVQVGGNVTNWFNSSNGVKQGDALSPTLFALFINDLLLHVQNSNLGVKYDNNLILNILAYADDIVLFSDNPEQLQEMLNIVSEWCKKWRLKINTDKTKIIQFRKSRKQRNNSCEFLLQGTVLSEVQNYKYLGVIFDEHLKYDVACNTLASAARRALGKIIYKSKAISGLGFNTFTTLYNSMVSPILEYGSEVWGHVNIKCSEKIDNSAIRYFLGVHRFAPLAGLAGDMGWTNTRDRMVIKMTNFYNRLLKTPDERLLKKIFLFDKNILHENSWSYKYRQFLDTINLENLFDTNQEIDNQLLANKLHDSFQTKWADSVRSKPKLRLYEKLKSNTDTENYVKANIPRFERSLIAQLRLGILPLRIETGRYVNEQIEDRVCSQCQENQIEDEIHFTLYCAKYHDARREFLHNSNVDIHTYNNCTDVDKLKMLMRLNSFGSYLRRIFNIRRNALYIDQLIR